MRKKVILLIMLVSLLIPTGRVLAQDYYFNLASETVNIFWNADGTESIDLVFDFNNQKSGHAIEYVDVGIPNANFDVNSIRADVGGNPVDVSTSDYQGSGSGVSVVMGQYAIQPGNSGTVHVFIGRVSRVLRPDDQDQNYVSAAYGTMYFGSQYVTGTTNMTVTFHFPKGVKPEEPRWHAAPGGFSTQPATGIDTDGLITYSWTNEVASASEQYLFGASFPKSYIPDSAIVKPDPLGDFLGAVGGLIAGCGLPGLFIAFFVFVIGASMYGDRKRRMQYLPPKISIEGHGIKRGLTAVEAAVVMEEPLDKVMTMILFGLAKKNAAQVVTKDPLEIQAVTPAPPGLYPYEQSFLDAFQKKGVTRQAALRQTVIDLIKSVTEKMRGFSRNETIAYYKDIMSRAWKQVEDAQTPDVKSQKFDEVMEWTMLDKDFNGRTRDVFHQGPVFLPMWWGRYDPVFGPSRPSTSTTSIGGGIPSGGGGGGGISRPSLPGGEFAASIVGGIQNFSGGVIGNITNFTNSITQTTNPVPKSTSSGGYRGGGGGGCACACACAGCACACAGGGR